MKNPILILLLLSGIFFSACKKEDEKDDTTFSCVSGNCTQVTNGNYATLAECETACGGGGGNTSGYNCVSGNCQQVSSGAAYSTLSACQNACAGGNLDPCTGTVSSDLYSDSGDCICDGESAGFMNNGWFVVAQWVGSSGTHTFTVDAFTDNCECPSLLLGQSMSPDVLYYAVGGSGTWTGSVFTFNAVVQTQEDYENGGTNTYNISGAVNCQ